MIRMTQSIFVASLAFLAACTVGESSDKAIDTGGAVTYLDTDGDGVFDAVDADFDGVADYYFDADSAEELSEVRPIAWCSAPLVDVDGDGRADGLDWNCDGVIDVWLTRTSPSSSPAPSGGTSSCKTSISQNGTSKTIECKNGECTCSQNGQVVSTCQGDTCSQPGNGNCCGF